MLSNHFYFAQQDKECKRILSKELNYPGNVDYNDLLKEANTVGRPLLLYFTCYNCVNAKKMEHRVLKKQSVQESLLKEFHFISLYVDDREVLPENERTQSKIDEKRIEFVGDKHLDLQETLVGKNSQPYFVIDRKSVV